YYLLIVGDPEEIPFSFQYQLDVAYAVGRIDFDTLEEYSQYAQSVVKTETSKPFLAPKARFFGTWNNNDVATEQSSKYLVKPLATWADTELKVAWKDNLKYQNWDIQTILKTEATKTKLSQLLGGDETPALLFTASHGLAFQDSRQEKHTGALLCQDWYKEHQGHIPEDWYFSADDISSDANKLLGLIAFHFACYGAGIPKEDEYGHKDKNWKEIAPRAFVAPLPKKLLSHPKGGALAVIGHVDRAWNQSFLWEAIDETTKGEQLSTFKSTLASLLQGDRVGYAVEEINKRYAALSTQLAEIFKIKERGIPLTLIETTNLVYKWTANNDARGFAIIGDPAVRL
ncbi:MAG: C25 family cysteine peptidase, partial [Planktothrix sp.]